MNNYTFYLKGGGGDQLCFTADWVGINEYGFYLMTGPCDETITLSNVIAWVDKSIVDCWEMKKSS